MEFSSNTATDENTLFTLKYFAKRRLALSVLQLFIVSEKLVALPNFYKHWFTQEAVLAALFSFSLLNCLHVL